ncbi:hypothetical protein POSPLADRAFT_1054715 [Postia placenta MAD-698-R-SB12]|uniref:EngB-type G domain-containing protein n=1 Tax=Postia placenta MAD-698-R-SB12 TaxID=670580 RepID=A0A1X6N624_9APHY|nr:hypothetical protein POSPLADRAFT_1054715 [Postia placenta MAD-698-R-SB12]OSX64099.1 hypothetical protein POSPLADRAFT_1054715 [Postia placenta MAD-698-R-SB12]
MSRSLNKNALNTIENLTRAQRWVNRPARPCTRHHSSRTTTTDVFSHPASAKYLTSATDAARLPSCGGLPEIVVTGRANVGKSTLMNAVMGRVNLCLTSKKAGRTQMLNFFRIGPEPGKLVLVDAPGYGDRGRQEWGALFDQYLQTRTELRRVFVCVNGTHGLNDHDRAMLQQLDAQCQASGGTRWTLQAIITKADALARAKNGRGLVAQIQHAVFEAAPTCLPAIVTAAAREPHFGIDEVRNSVAEACALR